MWVKNFKGAPAVLVPIAVATRELDSCLLLAAALADIGCRVIIGHKEALYFIARFSKNAIWLGRAKFKGNPSLFDILVKNGSQVMYFNEEGGIFPAISWEDEFLDKYPVQYLNAKKTARVLVW